VSNIAAQGIVTVGVNRPDHTFALGTTRTVPVYRPERQVLIKHRSTDKSAYMRYQDVDFNFNKSVWYFSISNVVRPSSLASGWKAGITFASSDMKNFIVHFEWANIDADITSLLTFNPVDQYVIKVSEIR
jgi:hypothetical protein